MLHADNMPPSDACAPVRVVIKHQPQTHVDDPYTVMLEAWQGNGSSWHWQLTIHSWELPHGEPMSAVGESPTLAAALRGGYNWYADDLRHAEMQQRMLDDKDPDWKPDGTPRRMGCAICFREATEEAPDEFANEDRWPKRAVVETGVAQGYDPTQWYQLSCGHTVI